MPKRSRIEYRPAIITFLDVLGFRDRVDRSGDATDIARILLRLRGFADVASSKDRPNNRRREARRSIAFSDSVIRLRFLDSDTAECSLHGEILSLVHLQGEMVEENVLLRGGMTVGLVHLDGDMVFGPGFNRAYDLESQFAQTSRIVIGQEAFEELRKDERLVFEGHTVDEDVAHIRKLVSQGDDGLWFVDYLAAFEREMDDPAQFPDYVARHRRYILAGARSASERSRVFQKYLWLARYLNGVVDRCALPPELHLTRDDIQALDDLGDRPHWMSDEEYEGRG